MKSTRLKNYAVLVAGAFTMLALAAFTFQNKPWNVPDKYDKMKNPLKGDAGSVAEGKALYGEHCQSCHGKKGKGDGPKSAQLETECGDFTSAAVAKETDGALFYKILEGRDDMPSFKKKISDEKDIWAVVNYMRTLK